MDRRALALALHAYHRHIAGHSPDESIEGRVVKPTLSLALARRCLGRMAPDVDRCFTEALHQSGLE